MTYKTEHNNKKQKEKELEKYHKAINSLNVGDVVDFIVEGLGEGEIERCGPIIFLKNKLYLIETKKFKSHYYFSVLEGFLRIEKVN